MDILKTPIPKSVQESIDNYIDNKIALTKFNPNNIASGHDIATLNETSGVLIFSKPATDTPSASDYTLNCNKITANSVVMYSVSYDALGDERLIPLSYIIGGNSVTFYLTVFGGGISDTRIIINYQILN